MRITLAVALVAISGSAVLAQDASQIGSVLEGGAAEVSTASVIVSEEAGTIVPVVYQSGTVGGGAVGGSGSRAVESVVGGSGSRAIEGVVVTEPSSVVSGEVIQSAPVYSEGVPVEGGTVVSDSTGDCGCGSPAPATYSSEPIPCPAPAPAAEPCCNQPRRGFFRRLFGF